MSSWASIAKAQVQPVAPPTDLTASSDGLRLLVVDANAIIGGLHLEDIADRAVTIQEVYDEIRDKRSRQFLATLPYQLQISEPSEDSISAVTRFARETGDVSTLSRNDIKLLALAYTLEVAAHGSAHLSSHAAQPRMHSKRVTSGQSLPGWGSVPNPEVWKAVDEANDADEAALLAASTSRIAQRVQQLSLDPSQPDTFTIEEQDEQSQQQQQQQQQQGHPSAAAAAVGSSAPAEANREIGQSAAELHQQEHVTADAVNGAPDAAAAAEGDDDGWEVAASSAAAARRKKKKQYKRAEKQRAFEAEWEEHARIMQQQQHTEHAVAQNEQQQDNGAQDEQTAAGPQQAAPASAEVEQSDDSSDPDQEAQEITNDELLAAEHHVYIADDADAAAPSSDQHLQQQQEQQEVLVPGMPGWQSSVACITADFAMQNVLLQMGLRLLTRDGRRIARLSRYALRCSACFTVTREPGRLFCPKCGNMTLDRVEVVVGPDGAEYFGIKKKHILRGTRFSLPKPKGGRNSKDPVLREDVFLLKVKALGRRAARKKPADDAVEADPLNPEYNQDSWHVASQAELAQHRGLAGVLQPAWKNNPNERKLTRSNRRG